MPDDVRLVNDAAALLSMRESDFDANSAFGEVVDNSIQARAKRIRIHVDSIPSGKRGAYEYIKAIAFGDDGTGMPPEVLHRCMQLGFSTRYNDRSGIGRFGVGMTLAAINQCKRVEIFSKEADGDWLWTYIDLDELTAPGSKLTAIPTPTRRSPPAKWSALAGADSGTLVVWSKYDRQPETAERVIQLMRVWMGRTYRHFLWNDLVITVNGNDVAVVDPLYIRSKGTAFSEDPPGHEFDPIYIRWPIPEDLRETCGTEESLVTIRMSLIHESLRPNQGSGGARPARERHVPANQGVSILRNKREVMYGPIPYWPGDTKWFSEIDRWWGCEISFDAVLDRAFTVKNIKRGAVPNRELKKAIYDAIKPTVETCREKVRDLWIATKKAEIKRESRTAGPKTGHEAAEAVAKKTPVDKSVIDLKRDIDKATRELAKTLRSGDTDEQQAAWIAKWKSQPFTIHDDAWRGAEFFEAVHLGGADVIRYNVQHPFFAEVYSILGQLESETGDKEPAVRLKNLIDLLIISYSKSEAKFERDLTITVEDFVEQMRMSWGQYLSSYMRVWLKEQE